MDIKVRELVNEINETRTQTAASSKDEVRVMQAMLNDKSFVVDVYGNKGIKGQYCPYEESRAMIANIIKDTTRINSKEASDLANAYEFGKQESTIMVGISKEFVNTYMDTGRKLPLGGRENSNISIAKKVKPEKVSDSGKVIPSHNGLKVYSGCPSWLK